MDASKYNDNFTQLLNTVSDYETIGLGNPNAKILLVGKEAAIGVGYGEDFQAIKERLKKLHGSAFQWKSNEFDYSHNPEKLKTLSDTWQNYQQLFENIYPEEKGSEYASFLKKAFATEMSNLPAKTTGEAKTNPYFKDELAKRKDTFFKTKFIESFPVVVLACSDYIINYEENREIDTIFGVTFFGSSKEYSRGNQFHIHYNTDQTKLVIHTRQLSGSVNNDLHKDMGGLIRDHLIKIGLYDANVNARY